MDKNLYTLIRYFNTMPGCNNWVKAAHEKRFSAKTNQNYPESNFDNYQLSDDLVDLLEGRRLLIVANRRHVDVDRR